MTVKTQAADGIWCEWKECEGDLISKPRRKESNHKHEMTDKPRCHVNLQRRGFRNMLSC